MKPHREMIEGQEATERFHDEIARKAVAARSQEEKGRRCPPWGYWQRGPRERAVWGSTHLSPLASLKLKLKRQLDRPWPANLVERIEAGISAAGRQAARQGLRRAAEQVRSVTGLPKFE
jgi:hypothetical protein